MSIKSPGLGAGGLASLSNYSTGSFTITLTGVSGTVTGTATYTLMGNLVTLVVPQLAGTSNSTAKGLSGIPAALRPLAAQRFWLIVIDSVITSNVGHITINTDGTATYALITPSTNASSTAFTATGAFTGGAVTVTYALT